LTGAAKWSSGELLFNEEIFSVFEEGKNSSDVQGPWL
jgi:hypothetical protein